VLLLSEREEAELWWSSDDDAAEEWGEAATGELDLAWVEASELRQLVDLAAMLET
jgi:hypothetical protein